MKKILRLTYSNIKSIFSFEIIFLILLLFNFIGLYRICSISSSTSFFDFFTYSFFTSLKSLENITEVLIWSLYQFSFIAIVSKFIYSEFKITNIYYISRIGNKFSWYLSLELTILIIALIYHFSLLAMLYIWARTSSNILLLTFSYKLILLVMLLTLSSLFYSNIYINLIMFSKKNISALLYIIFSVYISLYVGISMNINKFLPFNQVVISDLSIDINYLIISNIYLILLNIFSFVLSSKYILKRDLNRIID